jgi:hypothetical protein
VSDLKISQLPAAAPLTGAELIELVQSGANVQSTATAVSALSTATPTSVIAALATLNWTLAITEAQASIAPTPFGPGNGRTSQAYIVAGTGAGIAAQNANGPAGTMYGAIDMIIGQTAGAVNRSFDMHFQQVQPGVSYRKLSGGMPLAGFTFQFIGGFNTTRSDQLFFVGLGPGAGVGFSDTQIPSAILNMVGFGKDQGDTNLQFMVNNGSGTAAKSDTGLVFTNLLQHLFKLIITCDTLGAKITATLTDLEPNSPFATQTFTVLDGAAKNVVADTRLQPHMYVGNGTATSTVCGLAIHSIFLNSSTAGY